jgi:serine/threonine-protein kinase
MWPEIEPLLDRLLDLDEPERTHELERLTAGDPDTRHAIESLLRADRQTGGPLASPAIPPGALGADPVAPVITPGTRFGPYIVRRELGRGGMGAVLLAERDDGQFDQQVAIKWVRPDAWTPGAAERFLVERRILARLEHVNIARLLDGGVREDGAPYLVMERVEGEPITVFCDRAGLDVRGRVELFRQACAAVEYAHGQMVVHRDLKPDHILVTARGEVKLLDFGIAKLLDADTLATGTQARVFTPAYATPEQYLGDPPTGATDQYQLALILYELLTGRRAHQAPGGSPLAHQRLVLDYDPQRPSRFVPALSGDFDAILLKALEREPRERYESVEAFRRDLENVLTDRPVAARHGTGLYRARKFARRHRVAITAGALVVGALAVGLIGVAYQARIAARERDLALASEQKASAINEFVVRELLEAPTPERALGRPLTVAEVLASASRTVDHAFRGQPLTEAGVRMTLARSYQALGRLDDARSHAEAALRLLGPAGTPESRERLEARALLGGIALDQGRFDDAQRDLESVVAGQRRTLGPADPVTLSGEEVLGRALAANGRYAAAESTLRNAVLILPRDPRSWRLAVDLRRALAAVCVERAQAREAESLLTVALAIERRHLGRDHPLTAATLRQLAQALGKDLRPIEAERVMREVVAMSERLNGENHPATGDAYASLAVFLDNQRHHEQALEAVRHAAAIYRKALGDDHPKTLRMLRNYAVLLRGDGRSAGAESLYQEVYATCVRTLGPDHPQTLEVLQGLVYVRLDQGRKAEAAELARRIRSSYERIASRPDADPGDLSDYALYLVEAVPAEVRDPARALAVAERAVAVTGGHDYLALRSLGFAQAAAGQPRPAIASLRAALELPDGVRSWTTEDKLVELLQAHGTPGELEETLRQRLERQRALRGENDRYIAKTLRHLAHAYHASGRDELAERTAREVVDQLLKTLPPTHWEVGRARAEFGGLLLARGARSEAESLLVQGFRTLAADPDVPAQTVESARHDLVRLYQSTGRGLIAQAWREEPIAPRRIADP